MTTKVIDTPQKLLATVRETGLLPFFRCGIEGLSVEERVVPGMLFADMDGGMGAWDWKGPVIREMECTYGKFFHRKAGFVSLDLLPDFLNERRGGMGRNLTEADMAILRMIRDAESMTAPELRRELFGSSRRKGQSVESNLTRLQMAGYLVIADFEYNYTRLGDRYGWGRARYTTPEALFGSDIARTGRTRDQSFERLLAELSSRNPGAPCLALSRLIA
ncbi:MAG: hypothetical protein J6C91_09305 [Muribaculaceae bacterium]|nr:hypothetical protein [Muribaculaceae bacterium]